MASTSHLPKLDSTEAFLHVIYDYRYFAIAAYEWGLITYPDHVLRDRDALVQDALLLHARSLISFYLHPGSNTDIILSDFGIRPLSATRTKRLERYKKPIDVHLMHLTAYRDYAYRRRYLSSADVAARQRPNWNRHNAILIRELLEALRVTARGAGQWKQPFTELHAAALARTTSVVRWPKQLGEVSDVRRHIQGLGIIP
jgi:hypothetical protein